MQKLFESEPRRTYCLFFETPLLIINHTAPPSGPLTTVDNSRHDDSVPRKTRWHEFRTATKKTCFVFFAEPIKPQLEEISARAPTRRSGYERPGPVSSKKNHVEEPNRPLLLPPPPISGELRDARLKRQPENIQIIVKQKESSNK